MFKRHLIRVWIGIMLLSCMFLMGQEDWGQGPKQPTQEGAGPGDNTYICDPETGVLFDHNEAWIDDYLGYPLGGYIYAPACAQRPQEAPVVFFFHMAAADKQVNFEGFHRHLAGKGYIVIAPKYHRPPVEGRWWELFDQPLIDQTNAGIKGAKAGYEYYESHVAGPENVPTPMLDQGELVYGVTGLSWGGVIAASIANPSKRHEALDGEAEDFDWNPKAVVLMNSGQGGDLGMRCVGWAEALNCCKTCRHKDDPHWCPYGPYLGGQHCMATDGEYITGDLTEITYNPLWIVMVGEADWETGDTPELQAYCKTTNITDKHYLRVLSDGHGRPGLRAKHTGAAGADIFFPLWTGEIDSHDYYAYWKIVTGAMDCVTKGQNCNYVRGGTEEQINMGKWSDGTDVKKMQYNPRVRDNGGNCYELGDHLTEGTACHMVNEIDPITQESVWDWRGANMPADCGD